MNSSTSVASQSSQSTNLPLVQAYQADKFVNSIGVVTHLTYTDTNYYLEWPQVLTDLEDLGVRHIRDGFYDWDSNSPFFAEHQELHHAGINTDYVIPYNTSTTASMIESIGAQVSDMEDVEAPNECDVAGNCGATATESLSNLLTFLPAIDAAGSSMNVPVSGPAFAQASAYSQVGDLASTMTNNNLHVYFGGRNPGTDGWGGPDAEGNYYGSFAFWRDQANTDAPNVPIMISETGYMSFPGDPQPYTIPLSVAASYIPRTLLLAFKDGFKRTYIYELLDEVSSPGYGLIDAKMNPTPAYNAIQSLISNLSDKGASFSPGELGYSIQGGGSTLQQLLLQKRDGSFWLLLWLEQSSYDEVNCVSTPVTPQQITLTMDSSYVAPNVGTLDDTGHLTWASEQPASSVVPLTVSDQVTVMKILPK